jgi:cell division protein FtsW (lipid II flippase)
MRLLSRSFWLTLLAPRGQRATVMAPRTKRASLMATVAKGVVLGVLIWICLWWQAVIGELQKFPSKWALEAFAVTVRPNEPVELGWRDLGQKPGDSSAEERHIRLSLRNGELWLYNIAHRRRLGLSLLRVNEKGEGSRFETFGERFVIPRQRVSRITVDGGTLTFSNVTEKTFDLEVASSGPPATRRTYHYSGGPNSLQAKGTATWDAACAGFDLVDGLMNAARLRVIGYLEWMEAFMPAALARIFRGAEIDIAVLGGEYSCVERNRKQIGGIGRLPWRSLKIVRNGAVFMIAPYEAATRNRQSVDMAVLAPDGKVDPRARARNFQESGWRVDRGGPFGQLTEVIAGKTTYQTSFAPLPGGALRITFAPTSTTTLFSSDDCESEDEKRSCPSPLDTRAGALVSMTGLRPDCFRDPAARCWQWVEPGNPIAAGRSQRDISSRAEPQAWRGIAAVSALMLAGILGGGPLIAFQRLIPGLRSRARLAPYRTMDPLLLTLLSVLIALAPDLLARVNFIVNPQQALQITLANWVLAGIILMRGTSGILLGLLWVAVTILAALGSINLATMVVDGDTTRWLGYFVKHRVMFLDFVPPLVIAVAACPAAALRPALQSFVAGSSGWSRLTRFVPAFSLALLFLTWYFLGRQTGFGVFQPVEAGKFAMVLLVATTLLSLDPRMRTGSGGVALAASVVPLLSVLGLGALLLAVPLFRSDWSPVLIMVLLFAGVLAAFGATVAFRSLANQIDAHYHRQLVPRVFKPAFSGRWWLKRTWFYGLSLVVAAGFGAWFVLGSPIASTFATVAGVQTWKGDTQSRLLDLEREGLGSARRVVVERIISWLDLEYGRPETVSCAFDRAAANADDPRATGLRACYVDIEWQLIRSRHVVAEAQCGFPDFMQAGPGFAEVARTSARIGDLVHRVTAPVLGQQGICDVVRAEPDDPARPTRKVIRPIDIPVVESDFAGAYLVGRLGAASGLLFYVAQALLLTIVAIGFVRVNWTPSVGHLDEAIRRYTAIVLAGTAWLLMLQWSLSWSNILGLLPVMGQPMTWLSYATSHHLFVAVPCILVFIIGLRYAGTPTYRYTPRDPPQSRHSRLALW